MTDSSSAVPERWQYRYQHFEAALAALESATDELRTRAFSDLEREGLLTRFSVTWELAWKLLKDYLVLLGAAPTVIGPRTVLRAAYEARLIADASTWMDSLATRNSLVHLYGALLRDQAVTDVTTRYVPLFVGLRETFRSF